MSVSETLGSGDVHYFSRSRGELWRKGESSGQTQKLVERRLDCDGDTLLLLVDQKGVACHTGRRNCFFRAPRGGKIETTAEVESTPRSSIRSDPAASPRRVGRSCELGRVLVKRRWRWIWSLTRRCPLEPKRTLLTLREKLIKIGAKVVRLIDDLRPRPAPA